MIIEIRYIVEKLVVNSSFKLIISTVESIITLLGFADRHFCKGDIMAIVKEVY